MQTRKLILWFSLVAMIVLVVTACAAPPTPTPVPTPVPPTKPAVASSSSSVSPSPVVSSSSAAPAPTTPPTPVPTAVPPPAASPTAGPKKGGTLTMVVWQEPDSLNLELSSMTVSGDVGALFYEGLTRVNEKGERVPVLATEIPTTANGGISADGKTVTWKLRKNVKWHDGTDFTCDDLVFSWKAIMTPNTGALDTSVFADLDSVSCTDPNTAVLKFKNFRADWIRLYSGLGLIFPKNVGKPEDMKTWPYNRVPVGTGPFKVTEFVTGDHITLVRNDNYWQPGKPYLDKVVVKVTPSSEVAMQLMKNSEADIMWNNTEADIPAVEKMTNVKLSTAPQAGGERMILNTVKPGDPADNKTPHPILGDLKVRQAIAYGIDKDTIIKNVLNGKASPGAGELNIDPYNCNLKPYTYDVAKAKQLLDDAGWKVGSDGIRTKDGTRLRLKYSTTSGNKLREDTQVLIVENMKAIGVEFFIENGPSSLVIGSWAANSPRKKGSFDIVMYTTNAGIDPHSQMYNYFDSKSIPSPDNQGGVNYSRWNDPQTDQLIEKAGTLPDWPARKDLYCQAAARVVDGASHIYLYGRFNLHSFNTRVQGWISSSWAGPMWNAEDIWVK